MAGPLDGTKVVDITTNISGPSLTMILADLGAEVIKIERSGTGDDSRRMGPMWNGEGAFFLQINRNKRSIVVDLKKEDGKRIVKRFVKEADVFVENFRFGKAEQLGLGYEDLKELNPQLIYASINAYGNKGPMKEKPGYDAVVQADTGIMGMNGTENSEISRVPVSILDQGSAIWGALAVVSAILSRNRIETGQKVETSLYETGVFWSSYNLMSHLVTGEEPKKMGSNHAAFTPYGVFQTATEPIMIGVSNDQLFKKLCVALEKEMWSEDDRFRHNQQRITNRNELNYEIEKVLKSQEATYWADKLDLNGVPSAIIRKISDVATNEQTEQLSMLQDVEHSTIDNLKLYRLPISFSGNSTSLRKGPPLLGEDTKDILKEFGYDEVSIKHFIKSGVVNS
ncbi:CaiB/BaiF CoA transferase family protein [Virgibacillus byunsanensis]|uniref:CaiB/BaiF CoA transferase family protein n=1 Tax=Virgibacillus byunsanensis TaxID=570945 RepID=A0ABW3LH26_9BACI